MKIKIFLQEINLPLETKTEVSVLFSVFLKIEKFIKQIQNLKTDLILFLQYKIDRKLIGQDENKSRRSRGRQSLS